jgi:uncharacterized membrane protein YgdD (TMEM256/DUF423 family)
MTFGELAALAKDKIDGSEAVRTLYGWERDRLAAAMRGSFAFAASLLLALGASLLKDEIHTPRWTVFATAASSLVFVVIGLFILLIRLPRLRDEYLLAARLLTALKTLDNA